MRKLRAAPAWAGATIALLLMFFAGCGEEPVRTYRTAKESPPPAEAAALPRAGDLPPGHPAIGAEPGANPNSGDTAGLPAGHPPIGSAKEPSAADTGVAQAANSLTWAAPDHWVAKPLGAMRRGSFTAKNAAGEADFSIFVFPAASNPLLANINRWRGQIGLPPIAESQLATETVVLANQGLSFTTIDIAGQAAGGGAGSTRVLGAILYRGEEAWFFKLAGPATAVAAEKAAFNEFLLTVRPTAP